MFVVFIVLFMAGVNQWVCIGFIVSASLLLVWHDVPAQCPVRHMR